MQGVMTTNEPERARLVRLCASITRDRDAAEDLAQETLTVAWRRRDALRDADRREAWLNGIARNLCRGWLRARRAGGGPAPGDRHRVEAVDGRAATAPALLDPFDLEIEIERAELAR